MGRFIHFAIAATEGVYPFGFKVAKRGRADRRYIGTGIGGFERD